MLRIEGYSPDALLELLAGSEGEALLFCGRPVVFRAGSAEVLAEFRRAPGRLVLEVAHIAGGGEGVLPALWAAAAEVARRQGLDEVEWIVHAVACARPNLRLRRVLEKKGFLVEELPGAECVFRLVQRQARPDQPSAYAAHEE